MAAALTRIHFKKFAAPFLDMATGKQFAFISGPTRRGTPRVSSKGSHLRIIRRRLRKGEKAGHEISYLLVHGRHR